MAFYELDPWGAHRDNLHMAELASLFANANAIKGQSFSAADFMYKDPDQRQEENKQNILQGLLSLAAHGKEEE